MQYRKFGKTDWQVSEIGIGTWAMGGDWGPRDDEVSVGTLLYAFEKGINFVDTALAYGGGRSQKIIGKALKEWHGRDKIYVATKIIPLRWPSHLEDDPIMRGRYPEWYLREEVEKCLSQLGVERLDLLQLHCWVPQGLTQLDWLETLNALRREGKIDRIGVSVRDDRPEEGVDLARLGLVDSQQVVFNLFDQRASYPNGLFRHGEKTNTAFIARVPFDSGALIGNWNENSYANFPEGDMRRNYFKGERFKQTLSRVTRLKETCQPYYENLAEAAMRYILSDPAVAVVIPGMRTPPEVELNMAYSDGVTFPDQLKESLNPHCWARNFYF